ncbi:Poly [ADP-ribose] polymerase 6 [Balamuthia mandrillaris]
MSSLRRKVLEKLEEDIAIAQSLYDSEDATIQNIRFDGDQTVEFKVVLPNLATEDLALCIPDNYPKEQFTLLTPTELGRNLKLSNDIRMYPAGELKDVFQRIIDDFWKRAEIKKSSEKRDEKGKEKEKLQQSKDGIRRSNIRSSKRRQQKDKQLRESADGSAYDDDEEYDSDFGYDDAFVDDEDELIGTEWASGGDDFTFLQIDEKEAAQVRHKLFEDVEGVQKKYDRCGLWEDEVAHEYLVRLSLDTRPIDRWTAAAWGVDNTSPVIVELLFTWQYLNDRKMPPKVLGIFQSKDKNLNVKALSDNRDFGLRWYLNNRLSDTLRRNWVKYYRNLEDDKFRVIPIKNSLSGSKGKNKGKEKDSKKESKKDKKKDKKAKKKLKKNYPAEYQDKAKQLMEMGFEEELSYLALQETNGDVAESVSILMDGKATDKLKSGDKNKNKKKTNTDKRALAQSYGRADVTRLENFFAGDNFLANVVHYLVARMQTVSNNCVICDSPLGYEGLKPTVCSKVLCTHSFDAYGLGFSLTSELMHNPEVVDALVTITVAAAKNKRGNGADVFEPFPDAVQSVQKDKYGNEESVRTFRDGATKNFDLVASVCEKLPSIDEMKKFTDEMLLKAYLDNLDDLCYPLLRWIMMSNRAHLSLLPKDKHITEMQTPHQYVLVSDNPQKEADFRRQRAEVAARKGGKGSFYAFHGSAIGNWHSIFRNGLRNYSNTDKMSAGAAYGPGMLLLSFVFYLLFLLLLSFVLSSLFHLFLLSFSLLSLLNKSQRNRHLYGSRQQHIIWLHGGRQRMGQGPHSQGCFLLCHPRLHCSL